MRARASLVNEESMRSACIPAQTLFSGRPRRAAEASMVEQQHGQPRAGAQERLPLDELAPEDPEQREEKRCYDHHGRKYVQRTHHSLRDGTC